MFFWTLARKHFTREIRKIGFMYLTLAEFRTKHLSFVFTVKFLFYNTIRPSYSATNVSYFINSNRVLLYSFSYK